MEKAWACMIITSYRLAASFIPFKQFFFASLTFP